MTDQAPDCSSALSDADGQDSTYEAGTVLAQQIFTRTGRAAKPKQEKPKRGTALGEWLVEIGDTGECITNINAVAYLSPRSMRPHRC